MQPKIGHTVLSDLRVNGEFNPSELISLLLAYDHVRLLDSSVIPNLVQFLGVEGFIKGLEKSIFSFLAVGTNAMAKCDYTSPGFLTKKDLDAPLKFFAEVVYIDYKNPENGSFEERVNSHFDKENGGVNSSEKARILEAVLKSAIEYDPKNLSFGDDFRSDLFRSNFDIEDVLKSLIEINTGLDFSPKSYKLKIYEEKKNIYRVDTNIHRKVGMNEELFHDIVKEPFFSIQNTYLQLKRLQESKAAVGFNETQAFVIGKRSDFLSNILLESDTSKKLASVLEVVDVPSFEKVNSIDSEYFFDLVDSENARLFKEYLRRDQGIDANEVSKIVSSWRRKIGERIRTTGGKSFRFILSNGIGALDPLAGLAGASIDAFLEKAFPGMGPFGFIYSDYNKFANMHVRRIGDKNNST